MGKARTLLTLLGEKKKPPGLGDVWAAGVKIKIIEYSKDPPIWKTISSVMDTPKAIMMELQKLQKKYKLGELWIFSVSGKEIASDYYKKHKGLL